MYVNSIRCFKFLFTIKTFKFLCHFYFCVVKETFDTWWCARLWWCGSLCMWLCSTILDLSHESAAGEFWRVGEGGRRSMDPCGAASLPPPSHELSSQTVRRPRLWCQWFSFGWFTCGAQSTYVARANHKNSTEAHELAKQQLLDFKPVGSYTVNRE